MKVLGIDPGTAACGYGIVHESDGRLRAIDHGLWRTPAHARPADRLMTIFVGVQELLAAHAPDAVALEESFVGADARIALSVGQARGAVLVAAACAGVECVEYAPARVKQAVCGYGRAEKAQVQRMVRAILVAASSAGVEWVEYAPARVKQAVCGYGRADKGQMQRMVRMLLGLESAPRSSHAADALAVAICHALAPPLLKVAG